MSVIIRNKTGNLFFLALILISFLISSCGNESGKQENDTGDLSFSLSLETNTKAPIDCNATGIVSVSASIFNSSGTLVGSGGPWPCDAHSGRITGVNAGAGYRIVITAKNNSGLVIYSGERLNIAVQAGRLNNAGEIMLIRNNNGPVADAGNSVNVPLDSAITLDGSGSSDSDDEPLTFQWRFFSKPSDSGTSLENHTTKNPTFTADAFGTFKIELIVNNGYENSEPDIVEIVVGRVPDTGQAVCYDAAGNVIDPCPSQGETFYGQDACYTINPPSYTKLDASGNDLPFSATSWVMVRDNVTGLIWEVKTDDGSIHGKDKQFTWYDSNPATNGGNAGTPGDGTDTEDFISSLNGNNFGGYSDWRIPNVKELRSIMDSGRYNPAVNTDYFLNTMSPAYWSSTTSRMIAINAWVVFLGNGDVNHGNKSNTCYVRAVRGRQ